MDGLSVLFGVLTVLFLVVVVSMNVLGTQKAPSIKSLELDQEGFASGDGLSLTPSLSRAGRGEGFASGDEGFADAQPTLGSKIKRVLDPLALYTNPEGTPIPEGKDLCDIFVQVRKSMSQGNTGTSDAETMKNVEAQLAIDIPGGALPCPLLKYPADTATDLEWLEWLVTVPTDFGARVVFMANYADQKLNSVAQQMKDALSGNVDLPPLPKEGFQSVCTPMLLEKKRIDQAAATCRDPKSLSPQEIEGEVMKLLKVLVSEKGRVLSTVTMKDRTVALKDPVQSIRSAKIAAAYLNSTKQKAEAGTLAPTGVNPKLAD